MRMRKKKHGAERIAACSDIICQKLPESVMFPVEMEIGCGKGAFIAALAEKHPDTVYVAVERISDVLLLAAEKIKALDIGNVLFMIADARTLTERLPVGSVKRIYLNFSDPWPKSGYAKRRLTHRAFLEIYKTLLTPDGEIHFKTDNEALFDFSLEEFQAAGFTLRDLTRDLHQSPYQADNIMTEYEKTFSEKGFPIHRVVACKTE